MSENYKPLGMKWHNFLIYFALWTGGIGSFVSAAYIFCGMHYGNVKDRVYAAFPSLQFVDVAYAAALAALGVNCIYVRYQLAGSGVGFIINRTYYNNRKELFVN